MTGSSPRPWIVSPGFDLSFFIGPGLLGLLLALPIALGRGPMSTLPTWAWLILVLGVDVSHVWASLYRVYLDPEELRRRPMLYGLTPALVFGLGLILYGISSGLFWRVLAYVAVFHFIKQQWGFISLYRAKGGEYGPWIRRVDWLATWVGTGVPILYWHCHLPRAFVWFMEGDFIPGMPQEVMVLAWPIYWGTLALYLGQRVYLFIREGHLNLGKDLLMLTTWGIYGVGIVALNVDFAFTATNVLLHGIPYMALVWVSAQPRGSNRPGGVIVPWIVHPRRVAFFVGLLLALAFLEEGLWDGLIWQEHGGIFGDWSQWTDRLGWLPAIAVPLLTLPQGTHYILDGFIWRMDGSNPGLKGRLLEGPTGP